MDMVAKGVREFLVKCFGEEGLENAHHSPDFIVEEIIGLCRISAPRRCDMCGEDSTSLECFKCSAIGWGDD